MLRINNINLTLNYSIADLYKKSAKILHIKPDNIKNICIVKKSIDSRKKTDVHFVFNVDIVTDIDEDKILSVCTKNKNVSKSLVYSYKINKSKKTYKNPVIIGFGPAGMFAGLILSVKGLNPIIIERGKPIEQRTKDILKLENNSVFNPSSNVQFGEGGAGAFSDGKLNTGIKDKCIKFILNELVSFGAPDEILYESKPHIGTDNLKIVVKNCREKIQSLGGKFLFETCFQDFHEKDGKIKSITIKNKDGTTDIIDTDCVILAIGHSARDTFNLLYNKKIVLEQKPFSVGLRIEHLRSKIDTAQFGKYAGNKNLGAATYKLAYHTQNNHGVYTFCMCPGGQVICASSEKDTVVTNGMSNFARDNINSNSAVLVSVDRNDFKSDNPLAGVHFQRKLESKAFLLGGSNYKAPVQRAEDFFKGKKSTFTGEVIPSYKPGTELADLTCLFPGNITDALKEGLINMNTKIKGFAYPDAVLTGVESRSSSPIRILRDKSFYESVSVKGLYPIGEGAGYAGGIMSAAVDAVRCTENF